MDLGARLFRVALVALALAGGAGAALADGTTPGNGSLVALPALLPPTTHESLSLIDGRSGFGALSQKSDLQNDQLGFFSVRPESSSGDFTSLMRSGVGGGGLKFKWKW